MAEISPVVWWVVNFVQGQYYDIIQVSYEVQVQVRINLLTQQLGPVYLYGRLATRGSADGRRKSVM